MSSSLVRAAAVLGLVAALIGAALLSTYWLGGGAVGSAAGDPTSTAPDGAAALAALLRDRGDINVRVAASVDELGEPSGTLLVAANRRLPDHAMDQLRAAAQAAKTVVLIRPDGPTLSALAPGVSREGSTEGALTAGCANALADPMDAISGPTHLYRTAPSRGSTCFVQAGVGVRPAGAVVLSETAAGGRRIVVGNREMFTNAHLTGLDNAAVALRMLGQQDGLTWYTGAMDSESALSPTEQKLWPPPWLGPLTLALLGALVSLMVWRGRRLGRLATEPLPVIVQANETTLARGRLYRRAQEPAYAARILQQATLRRLAGALGLAPGSLPAAVGDAAARVCGRSPDEIQAQLIRVPSDNADLASLAGMLTAIEKEVRRT